MLPFATHFSILRLRRVQGLFFRMICPQCRSTDCFRSHRQGLVDFGFTILSIKPWRCHSCAFRFYAHRVALAFSKYAHCPRCGNFDLEHLRGDRVDRGTLVGVKRWLAFPAYRCAPCRTRFFSTRPFRRIIPSTIPALERAQS